MMLNYGGIVLVSRELIVTMLFWFIIGFLLQQVIAGLIELFRFLTK